MYDLEMFDGVIEVCGREVAYKWYATDTGFRLEPQGCDFKSGSPQQKELDRKLVKLYQATLSTWGKADRN